MDKKDGWVIPTIIIVIILIFLTQKCEVPSLSGGSGVSGGGSACPPCPCNSPSPTPYYSPSPSPSPKYTCTDVNHVCESSYTMTGVRDYCEGSMAYDYSCDSIGRCVLSTSYCQLGWQCIDGQCMQPPCANIINPTSQSDCNVGYCSTGSCIYHPPTIYGIGRCSC